MSTVLVINGPNLNLLGTREPDVYGSTTLAQLNNLCIEWGAELGLAVTAFQSNHEGAIIDRIHAAAGDSDGIVINAGALTHYSYAVYDALVAVAIPTVEVHISDIHSREEWRRASVIQPACLVQISGEGLDGYRRALAILAEAAG
ncbi:MAG: type II 3-dehydroquinate dehydratase [Acidimicrobiia bacterium]|nr:type II 3-dehydroquinate dehydratase [Acidimicrobiia bacterium]